MQEESLNIMLQDREDVFGWGVEGGTLSDKTYTPTTSRDNV